MKKRNLLLVILAVLLVFGMVMSCGGDIEPEEPEPPAPPTPAEKAAKFFGGYNAVYKETAASTTNTNERIKFEEKKLVIWDDTNYHGSLNYLEFEITKWDDATTPSFTDTVVGNQDNFKIAFKLTGKIKGAFEKTATYLYGSKTAPGFVQKDIEDGTEAIIYLYIQEEDDDNDLTILRSIITKDGGNKAPITGVGNAVRFYREPNTALQYPTY